MAKIDTTGFKDKASKNPEEMELYEKHDYIEAYSLHTDLRIERDGYDGAIGSNEKEGQGWVEHGSAQLGFLIHCGMEPGSTLLDFGCGTGRLARQAVPYLNEGNYTGIDISKKAIETARQFAREEGWGKKAPTFIRGDGSLAPVKDQAFDIIWAHSVLTHTPWDIAEALFQDLSEMNFGSFYFTFKQADEYKRTGLKQFSYSPRDFERLCKKNGLKCKIINIMWPAKQRTMCVY